MRKQISRFKCALSGVWCTIKSENHMRFHIVAGFYVLLFSPFYNFSATQMAVLLILIASVMTAETINTCVEELCNFVNEGYEPIIKFIKDAAAGAVLLMSIFAAVIGVMFYLNFEVIADIYNFFVSNIWLFVLLVLSAILSVLFVWLGPTKIKEKIFCLKTKK